MKESALPRRLSPSRAQDFIDCPKKFYYKTIEKLVDPPSIHTARGTITHTALERLFDHPRGERTVERALAYVRPAWDELKSPDLAAIEDDYLRQRAQDDASRYKEQLDAGNIDEDELIRTAEKMVRNYFSMEDPNAFDPEARELVLSAEAAGVPLTGIIDRLDKVVGDDGETRWYISDYKTAGKIPSDRWIDGKFFGMRVYAVLAKEQLGIQVTGLRLIYLKGAKPETIKYQPVTEESLDSSRKQLKALWDAIQRAERTDQWPTKTGPLCNWCAFMSICPAWAEELKDVDGAQAPADRTARDVRKPAGRSRPKTSGAGGSGRKGRGEPAASARPGDPLRGEHQTWGGPDDVNADF